MISALTTQASHRQMQCLGNTKATPRQHQTRHQVKHQAKHQAKHLARHQAKHQATNKAKPRGKEQSKGSHTKQEGNTI